MRWTAIAKGAIVIGMDARRWMLGFVIAAGFLALLCLALHGRLPSPALRPVKPRSKTWIDGYPRDAEPVSISVDTGVEIRGVFVPSDPGAPVVLHLLESGGSAASMEWSPRVLTSQLADLGWASLVLDYEGVGVSSGTRSTDHLERDALAMWDAAVWRAGGDPKRVVVRATSLGTVAAGLLLKIGAEPAAVVLIAPVIPNTVVPHFARTLYGRRAEVLAGMFGPVVDFDFVDALRHARTKIIAISSADETLVDLEERIRLHDAVVESGGRWYEHDNGHFFVAAEAHGVLAEEERLLESLHGPPLEARAAALVRALEADVAPCFPKGSEELGRLEELARFTSARDVRLVAAAALAFHDVNEAERMVHSPPTDAEWMSFDDLALTFSLEDPCGPLPFEALAAVCRREQLDRAGIRPSRMPATIAGEACDSGDGWGYGYTLDLPLGKTITFWNEDCSIWPMVERRDLGVADNRRRFARILLKAEGFPDRVRRKADGTWMLEYRRFVKWHSLDLIHPSFNEDSGTIQLIGSGGR